MSERVEAAPSRPAAGEASASTISRLRPGWGDDTVIARRPHRFLPFNEERHCGALTGDNLPCRRAKGHGTAHPGVGRCKFHGGNSPDVIKAALRVKAERAVATYGLPLNIDPHVALLHEVQRTAGHVLWLQQRIRTLEAAELVWSEQVVSEARTRTEAVIASEAGGSPTPPASEPQTGSEAPPRVSSVEIDERRVAGAQVSVWLKLYQSERHHLVEVCKTAIACGIAERQVRIHEEQGNVIAGIITGVLADLGIELASDAVRESLSRRLIEASEAAPVLIEAEVIE